HYTPTPHTYTLSLHDALPISTRTKCNCSLVPSPAPIFAGPQWLMRSDSNRDCRSEGSLRWPRYARVEYRVHREHYVQACPQIATDRKSTRLNSSHDQISYAVF